MLHHISYYQLVFRTNRIVKNSIRDSVELNSIRIRIDSIRQIFNSIRFDLTNHVILCQLFPFLDYALHKFPTKKLKKIKKHFFMERLSPKKEMIFIKSRYQIVEFESNPN